MPETPEIDAWDGLPPTLEEVVAVGYAPEVAQAIVDEEQAKFNAGAPPYDKPHEPGASEPEPTAKPGPSGLVEAVLQRSPDSLAGMFGLLHVPGHEIINSLELSWQNNKPDVSCVPAGRYLAKLQPSQHFGRQLYHLQGVPGRSNCMIHQGNWAGDKARGMLCDVEGCILLGLGVGMPNGQQGVTSSLAALGQFMDWLEGADFWLTILPSEPGAPA